MDLLTTKFKDYELFYPKFFCFSARRLYFQFDQRTAPTTKAANQGEVREQLFP